jgi:hypothetical protein
MQIRSKSIQRWSWKETLEIHISRYFVLTLKGKLSASIGRALSMEIFLFSVETQCMHVSFASPIAASKKWREHRECPRVTFWRIVRTMRSKARKRFRKFDEIFVHANDFFHNTSAAQYTAQRQATGDLLAFQTLWPKRPSDWAGRPVLHLYMHKSESYPREVGDSSIRGEIRFS